MTEARHIKRSPQQNLFAFFTFAFFFAVLFTFLKPVLIGLLLALAVAPALNKFFLKKKISRRWGAGILTTLVSLFFVAPIVVVIVMLVSSGVEVTSSAKEWAANPANIENIFLKVQNFIPFDLSYSDLAQKVSGFFEQSVKHGLAFLADVAGSVPKFTIDMIILILTMYYGLVDGPTLVKGVRRYLPFDRARNERILEVSYETIHGTFVATVLSAGAQALVIVVAYLTLGVPRAGVAGALTFFTAFVPFIGTVPAGIFGVGYLLYEGMTVKAVVMLVLMLFAGTVDNIIKPIVLKGSADLHPLLGLLSALGGLALMGFVGIFIGPMIAALCLELINILDEEHA